MGGTTEAPAWLTPAAHPATLPGGAASGWPHMQDNYGSVKIGGAPNLGGGGWQHMQDNYGAVKVAATTVNQAGL